MLQIVSAAINTLKSTCEQEEQRKNEKIKTEDKENTKKIEIIFLIHAFKFSSSAVVQSISWKSSLLSASRILWIISELSKS
jgi:hypothetical protein